MLVIRIHTKQKPLHSDPLYGLNIISTIKHLILTYLVQAHCNDFSFKWLNNTVVSSIQEYLRYLLSVYFYHFSS